MNNNELKELEELRAYKKDRESLVCRLEEDNIPKNKINILGTEYTVELSKKLPDGLDGRTDRTTKVIEVCSTLYEEPKETQLQNLKAYADTVLRHETIHAILNESGLEQHTSELHKEEVVNWIAMQYPKMKKIFEKLGVEE